MSVFAAVVRRLFVVSAILLVAACGGGGGATSGDSFLLSRDTITFGERINSGNAPAPQTFDVIPNEANAPRPTFSVSGSAIESFVSYTYNASNHIVATVTPVNPNNLGVGTHTAIVRVDNGRLVRNVNVTYTVSNFGTPGTSSGSLDGTFGSGGAVVFSNSWQGAGRAITTDSNGRIVVAGNLLTSPGISNGILLWRYNPDGTLDTTFGDNPGGGVRIGWTSDNIGNSGSYSNHYVEALAIDSSARILVTGHMSDCCANRGYMVVLRYTSQGVLDTTFANSGRAIIGYPGSGDGYVYASDMALDSTGRIFITGSISAAGTSQMALWRLTSTGTVDVTFGGDYNSNSIPDGYVKYSGAAYASSFDQGFAIKIDTNSKILIGATSGDPYTYQDMVVWRLNTDGSLDTTFGVDYNSDSVPDGFYKHHGTTATVSFDSPSALMLDSSNRIIAAGSSYNSTTRYDMVVWRLTANGTLDTSFGGNYDGIAGSDGYFKYDRAGSDEYASSVAVDSSGRIVVAGASTSATDSDVTIWRLTSNGILDAAFASNGISIFDTPTAYSPDNDRISSMTIDSTGRILATGSSLIGGSTTERMTLFRFLP